MTGVEMALSAFHFLRVWVLVGLVPLALLWWQVRRPRDRRPAVDVAIAPHLRDALSVGRQTGPRLQVIDLVALCLTLLILAAAGPTWSRVPQPFAAQTAPLVVVLKVTESMQSDDVAPTRLDRGRQKIRDLLALRAGARTALVAYAGSAHGVVPMTEDPNVMVPYLEGLAPDVMPSEGDNPVAALELAQEILARESEPGGVLFVLDDMALSEATAIAETSQAAALAFLVMLPDGTSVPALAQTGGLVVQVTPDQRDLTRIERAFQAAYREALLEDGDQPWQDRGALLAWPAALLLLMWFRRGVTMRWAVVLAALLLVPAGGARAEGWRDWFATPDQQGWIAYRNKDYAVAAERFADPYLRGVAQYRAGQYEAAAETLSRIDSADAAFAEGMAHIKSRSYRDGVRGFERALELDPSHAGARANLPVAREIVDYVETTREQSDTGEERGAGADEVVFDNEAARGADTQIEVSEEDAPQHMTTEQWMNTVDTSTGDFLRQRFRLEAAGDGE